MSSDTTTSPWFVIHETTRLTQIIKYMKHLATLTDLVWLFIDNRSLRLNYAHCDHVCEAQLELHSSTSAECPANGQGTAQAIKVRTNELYGPTEDLQRQRKAVKLRIEDNTVCVTTAYKANSRVAMIPGSPEARVVHHLNVTQFPYTWHVHVPRLEFGHWIMRQCVVAGHCALPWTLELRIADAQTVHMVFRGENQTGMRGECTVHMSKKCAPRTGPPCRVQYLVPVMRMLRRIMDQGHGPTFDLYACTTGILLRVRLKHGTVLLFLPNTQDILVQRLV